MKLIYTILILTFIFYSCGKDKGNAPAPLKQILFSKRTFTGTGNHETYEYDAQRRMIKRNTIIIANPKESSATTFTYNAQGSLIEFFNTDNNPATPDYNSVITHLSSNTETIDHIYTATGEIFGSSHYEYGTTSASYLSSRDGTPVYGEAYTLSANGKNVEKVQIYNYAGGLPAEGGTITYSGFDDKKSGISFFPALYPVAVISSQNNPTRRKTVTPSGTVATVNYQYEYNQEGYPVKRTADNGEEVTYEYIYQ